MVRVCDTVSGLSRLYIRPTPEPIDNGPRRFFFRCRGFFLRVLNSDWIGDVWRGSPRSGGARRPKSHRYSRRGGKIEAEDEKPKGSLVDVSGGGRIGDCSSDPERHKDDPCFFFLNSLSPFPSAPWPILMLLEVDNLSSSFNDDNRPTA